MLPQKQPTNEQKQPTPLPPNQKEIHKKTYKSTQKQNEHKTKNNLMI